MSKIIIHSTLLIAITFLTSAWNNHETLSHYSLQAISGLALAYLIFHKYAPKKLSENTLNIQSTLFLTTISLMLVFSTGGAVSPLFFILYFLLFGLSVLFEPIQTIILSFVILIPLVTGIDRSDSTIPGSVWGNMITLLLITPMATIFGKKLIELQNKSTQVEDLETKIVIEETNTTSWINDQLTPNLHKNIDTLVAIVSDKNLPSRLATPLTKIYQDLKGLLKTAQDLEKKLDDN